MLLPPRHTALRVMRESGPFRVLTAAAGVPAGTEKRSVPRLFDYLRCTHNHRRPVCSHPAPGMDHSPICGDSLFAPSTRWTMTPRSFSSSPTSAPRFAKCLEGRGSACTRPRGGPTVRARLLKLRPWRVLSSGSHTFRRVFLFAPSAPAVQIFIPTMRAFDRSQLIVEIRQRFAARCCGRNRDD